MSLPVCCLIMIADPRSKSKNSGKNKVGYKLSKFLLLETKEEKTEKGILPAAYICCRYTRNAVRSRSAPLIIISINKAAITMVVTNA